MNTLTVTTLAILIGATAFAIDASIPAIPQTASALGSEVGLVQLTIGLYMLGYGLAQIPVGILADQFGRRPVVLAGMTLFVVSGLMAALSTSIEMLLISRFFQGLFGATGAVITRAIVRDLTSGAETGRLMSLLTTTLGGVMVIAPLLGALGLTFFGWRAPFLASSIFAAIGLVLMFFVIPETLSRRPLGRLRDRFFDGVNGFRKSPQSLLGAGLVGFSFCGLISIVTLSSEVFIVTYGFSAVAYAFVYAGVSMGYAAGGVLARHFLKTRSVLDLSRITAMFFALIGLGFLASILTPWGGYILLTALSVLFFAGVSAMLALGTTMALEPLPKTAGMAAALLGTYQLTLGALVASLISSLGFESLYVLQIVLMALGFLIFGLSRLAKKAGYAPS